MAVQIYEDTWDVETETLQPVAFNESPFGPSSYPLPPLRPTGRRSVVTLRTVVLENRQVKVVVVPDLGGRIVQVTSKATGTEPLALPTSLEVVEAPPRGAGIAHGIQVQVLPGPRPNAMGVVDRLLREPAEDTQSGAVFLYETVVGTPLSWHAAVTLAPDAANVLIELKVFNRSLHAATALPGLSLGPSGPGSLIYDPTADAGLALVPGPAVGEFMDDEGLLRLSFGRAVLAPRETRHYRAWVCPFSGIGLPTQVTPALAWSGEGTSRIAISTASPRPAHQAFVGLSDGQTLQAPVSLEPGRPFVAELPGTIERLLVRDADGLEVLRSDDPALRVAPPRPSRVESALSNPDQDGSAESALNEAIHQGTPAPPVPLALRHVAHVHEATRALRSGALESAKDHLTRSLATNAEDPLAWWLLGLLGRLTSDPADDRPETLNAHYLAPLEPSLRAEAYLSIPPTQSSEPSPVLKPLAANPDALLDVLCRLLEIGLPQEAARLADEALRHREIPLVRYLYGWSLHTATRMAAEAADQVRRASTAPLEPPYPWRPLERRAVSELAALFPDDRRLADLRRILEENPLRG